LRSPFKEAVQSHWRVPGTRLRRWRNVAIPTATARSRGSFRLRRLCRFNATDFGETSRSVGAKQPVLRTPLIRQKQHAGFINVNLARILKKEFWACLQVTRRFYLRVMLKIGTSYVKTRNSLPESACHCRRTALQSPPGARLRRWQNVAHPTARRGLAEASAIGG